MRKFSVLAAAVAVLVLGDASWAHAHGGDARECDPCNDGHGHGGLFGHHGHKHKGARYEGLQPGFNCGCNGSYKFPVPPLYTYHWPGMWSAQLMTDYHSPWRFPPLKPYVDEVALPAMGKEDGGLRRIQPVSATASVSASEPASFSRHLERMSR